jgi:hypothetical protein
MTAPATSNQLLRKLGGITPTAAPAPVRPAAQAFDDTFARMFELARGGKVESGRPVTIDSNTGVTLTPEQLARVGTATDKAESAGFATALVLIDGAALMLDVEGRRIMGVTNPAAQAVTGIDGVVAAAPAQASTDPADPAAQAAVATPPTFEPARRLLGALRRPTALPPAASTL